MKKSDKNLLIAAVGLGGVAWYLTKKKDPNAVSGIPGIGAILPTNSLIPEKYRGQCSPAILDIALWGSLGAAAGYYGLAGKKMF